MIRKSLAIGAATLLMTTSAFAQPVEPSATMNGTDNVSAVTIQEHQTPEIGVTIIEKTIKMENALYGTTIPGALVDRLNNIEKDIFGAESKSALIAKSDRLYSYVHESTAVAPSLIMRVNALEWTLTHDQTSGSLKTRISDMERLISGTTVQGGLDAKVAMLDKLAYAKQHPTTADIELPKDTLIKIKMTKALSTKTSHVGDTVEFKAADDVYVHGLLAVPKGAIGTGKILKSTQAKNFGRDAKLEIEFTSIGAIDGKQINTFVGEKAQEETKSMAKAAGATVVGMAILGPVGVVGGAFVQGEEVKIPAGAEMFVQTKEINSLNGLEVR